MRVGLLPEKGLWAVTTKARRLSAKQYLLIVAAGVALTAAQVLALPPLLGAKGFAVVILGISATQAFFNFGDLGFGRLGDNTLVSKGERDHFRTLSMVTGSLVLTLTMVVCAIAMTVDASPVFLALPIGAATAFELFFTQLRAQTFESLGDEVGGALRHFIWQNMPKLGLIAGAVVTRSAIGSMLAGLAVAVVVSPPKICSSRYLGEVPRLWNQWCPSLLSVVAPFTLAWADTYFVAIHNGLVATAGYALTYRVLGGVTYLYLPFGSVLLSRLNAGDKRAAWRVPFFSVLVTTPVLVLLGAGIGLAGPRILEHTDLDHGLVLPLAGMYVFANLSFLIGTSLFAYGRYRAVLVSNTAGAAVAVTGHLLFTIRSSPVVAARVSLAGVATTAVLQCAFAWREVRSRPTGAGRERVAAVRPGSRSGQTAIEDESFVPTGSEKLGPTATSSTPSSG